MKNRFLFFCITFVSACSSIQKNKLMSEQHRSQFHFTPQKGWMNDPNDFYDRYIFFK
jgi:sucrose-6-phosphate hydrolase SacC (GH32 family)